MQKPEPNDSGFLVAGTGQISNIIIDIHEVVNTFDLFNLRMLIAKPNWK